MWPAHNSQWSPYTPSQPEQHRHSHWPPNNGPPPGSHYGAQRLPQPQPPPAPAYYNHMKRTYSDRHSPVFSHHHPQSLPRVQQQSADSSGHISRGIPNRPPLPHSPGNQFLLSPLPPRHNQRPVQRPIVRTQSNPSFRPTLSVSPQMTLAPPRLRPPPDEIDRQTELFTNGVAESPRFRHPELSPRQSAHRYHTPFANRPRSRQEMPAPAPPPPPPPGPRLPSILDQRPASSITPRSSEGPTASTDTSVSKAQDDDVPMDDDKHELEIEVEPDPELNVEPELEPVPDPVPLKQEDFQEYLKREESNLYVDYFASASTSMTRANHINALDKLETYTRKVPLAEKSPFSRLTSIKAPKGAAPRSKGSTGELTLAHFVAYEGHPRPQERISTYQNNTFAVSTFEIPVYTHYVSSKHNALVEGDKQRTFLPYLGEAEDFDDDYQALEQKILQNQEKGRSLNESEEFAKPWILKIDPILADLGTSTSAVLQFLIDESIRKPPKELPAKYADMFEGREDWITDGYYEQEDDAEATRADASPKPKRPQKRWRVALKSLPKADGISLARAILACYVFMDVAGFSLWHVIRLSSTAKEACRANSPTDGDGTVAYSDPFALQAYVDQACLICKTHQCSGHGEFSEDEDGHDIRLPMTSGFDIDPVLEEAELARETRDLPEEMDMLELLGKSDSGLIEGQLWTSFKNDPPGMKDDECCSLKCFWDKGNRAPEMGNVSWLEKDLKLLSLLGPAYATQKRGACVLSRMGVFQRTCVEIFYKLVNMAPERSEDDRAVQHSPGHSHPNKSWRWWLDNSRTWKHDERAPFRPCNHTGKCKNNPKCPCFQQGISCEKSCNCPSACTRRFRGCTCHAMNKACIDEKSCDCRALNRECDPDLCVTCGSHEVLDPANRYNDKLVKTKCGNVSIQRAVPRRTQIGQSALLSAGGVVGWGLFMGEEVRKGEYIGEYIGEIVTPEESEQRGIIYNAMNLSYLFDLNSKQVLDSTPIGNKLRYINHQGEDFANCQAKVMFCNGVQRIGMFAVKNIRLGEELLFNYGEGFASKIDMVKIRKDGTVTMEKAKKGIDANTKTSAHKKLPNDIGKRTKLVLKGKRKGKKVFETMDGVLDDEDLMDLDGDDASSDEDGGVADDEDDDDAELFEAPRAKARVSSKRLPISHSERMQKAWVSRYRNRGMYAEAEEQQKKLDELQRAKDAEAGDLEKRVGKKRARRQSL